MAEPQPPTVQEGAADPRAPASDVQENGAKEADSKALNTAMKNLNVQSTASEEKKNVKVEPADVNLLVSQLELSRQRATDLLRAYDGSAVRAMGAFVGGRA
ncbi:hypothetical protein N0V95_001524 [Ascochyta clinopodiicola]|nr:hypothetical protein N0V95_001524 [Ascochyta clinopodiicola]